MAKKSGTLRVGTSGIVVPGTKQTFPAEFRHKSRLNYYASLFNTLEVNSSFYKVPMLSTFEKWSLDVPEDFRFTIKLWREITHVKNLDFDPVHIGTFLKAASGLGNKKGCLLVQFPGKITLDFFSKVEHILEVLTDPGQQAQWPLAIEFRSPTWYTGETYELLDQFNASIVLHDIPKARTEQVNKSAKFIYLRYHGPTGDYRGSYSDAYIREQSRNIRRWLTSGKDVYAYFNNTMGKALENATTLKAMVEL